LSGAVISGQVAIGEHIVQIHAEHGAIVNYRPAVQRAVPHLRPIPIRLLPRPFDALVGRDQLLSDVHSALARRGPVELVGEPGIGKTSVLRNVSHHLAELQPDGVMYTAARGQPASDLLQFLFESFYNCGGEVVVATTEELSHYLGDRRALIAVDDAELGREEFQRVMDVVASSTFLYACTDRRLWGEGESLEVEGIDEAAAVTLLERELGRPLASEEKRVVLDACTALHGSPLRILQFAGLLRSGTVRPGEITAGSVELARAKLDRLLAGELSDRDRRVISPLAAVDAPVPTDAVAAVTGVSDTAERLSGLEERHVVESHSPRYTLAGAPTAGLFSTQGRDHDTAVEMESARTALVGLFAGDADGVDVPQRFEEPEFLLALVREADQRGSVRDVLTLARAADRAFALRGRWGAWRVALDAALAQASARGLKAEEGWALHQLGSRALGLGDREEAARHLSRALELRIALGDRAGAAVTRHNLDLLSGPPPPGQPPKPPRPRPPVIAVLLATLALLVGVALTIGLVTAGGSSSPSTGVPASSTTGSPTSGTGTGTRSTTGTPTTTSAGTPLKTNPGTSTGKGTTCTAPVTGTSTGTGTTGPLAPVTPAGTDTTGTAGATGTLAPLTRAGTGATGTLAPLTRAATGATGTAGATGTQDGVSGPAASSSAGATGAQDGVSGGGASSSAGSASPAGGCTKP
jgi:hypothetical protein